VPFIPILRSTGHPLWEPHRPLFPLSVARPLRPGFLRVPLEHVSSPAEVNALGRDPPDATACISLLAANERCTAIHEQLPGAQRRGPLRAAAPFYLHPDGFPMFQKGWKSRGQVPLSLRQMAQLPPDWVVVLLQRFVSRSLVGVDEIAEHMTSLFGADRFVTFGGTRNMIKGEQAVSLGPAQNRTKV